MGCFLTWWIFLKYVTYFLIYFKMMSGNGPVQTVRVVEHSLEPAETGCGLAHRRVCARYLYSTRRALNWRTRQYTNHATYSEIGPSSRWEQRGPDGGERGPGAFLFPHSDIFFSWKRARQSISFTKKRSIRCRIGKFGLFANCLVVIGNFFLQKGG